MKFGRVAWLIVPWALFVALALGWIGYWNYVASQVERQLTAWQFDQNASGAHVSHGIIVRHGFPVLLRLEIPNISYTPARAGWRLQTARADLNVDLLNPQHIILKAQAPIAVSRADGAVTNVTAQSLVASVRMQEGALAVAGVEADGLVLDDPAQPGTLAIARFVANARPDPRRAGDYQLAVKADNLTLPRPVRSLETFGLSAPLLRGAIVVEHGGALLQGSQGDPLGPWREVGGKLRFEALDLQWGPLRTSATGEGELDPMRRLEGRLVIPVAQPAPVLNAIANGPTVSSDARSALQLLAAGYLVSGHQITLDVGAHDGILTIENIPVRPLPSVY
ncbi:MAG: DUF2125 domain-containing protein [Proteobacteria bacterium]|nr:DUF2125 domain-containing protein [Pseudomonadota bacterium]